MTREALAALALRWPHKPADLKYPILIMSYPNKKGVTAMATSVSPMVASKVLRRRAAMVQAAPTVVAVRQDEEAAYEENELREMLDHLPALGYNLDTL